MRSLPVHRLGNRPLRSSVCFPTAICLALLAACVVLMGCTTKSPSEDQYAVSRDIDLVDARREAIALELELYDLLTNEFGVGEWEAPPEHKNPQVSTSMYVDCHSGYQSEAWSLASAGPIPDERWEEAIDRVGEYLAPRGFGNQPQRFEPGDGHHRALYINETTGARVQIGYNLATLVVVDTGCSRGTFFGDWPDGTELIPTRLRTSGRARYDLEHEIWPTQTPNG